MIMHSAEVHATNAQVTCNGAYQFGMDDETGSLEAGKLADLAVLDHNPLNVDPADIRNVSVEATVLRGRQTARKNLSGV
jgi:predicted amidohydrolase YtcJ